MQGHSASCWTHPKSSNCAFMCALWPTCFFALYTSVLFFSLIQLTTILLIIWQEKLQKEVDSLFSVCSHMPEFTSWTTTAVLQRENNIPCGAAIYVETTLQVKILYLDFRTSQANWKPWEIWHRSIARGVNTAAQRAFNTTELWPVSIMRF